MAMFGGFHKLIFVVVVVVVVVVVAVQTMMTESSARQNVWHVVEMAFAFELTPCPIIDAPTSW